MTILVVDDNEQNCYQLQILLGSKQYQVVTAVNGSEALAKARQSPPDLIISDILMPVMDGFALCREWNQDERLRSIPFIFYTATYTDERDRDFALGLGAERFLIKPAEPVAFLQAIAEVIQHVQRPSGTPPARSPTEAQQQVEVGYLRQYNEVLVRKLEKKMQELEQTNRELMRDITERNQAEAAHEKLQAQFTQAQKMESVGRLAGGVAHDFNNMLMGIMNYADLCRDKLEPNHPIREWLNEITVDAERSVKLTHQLLAFARKQIIAPKVMDINDAISSMHKLLRRLIGEDIAINLRPGPNVWPVKMDPIQIDQILANLVVNARDAIGGVGSIAIETSNVTFDAAYCADHAGSLPGDYTLLTVTDSGCGMDEGTLKNIFEPFFTTKADGEGTGLGLATVYGIVKQNDGFINLYSEPGEGTTFRIYLPRFAGAEIAQVSATAVKPPHGTETVLLVEDEKSVRVTTHLFLEDLGYTVLVAEAPNQALELVAEHPGEIDLLITDVIMPGMSGRDLAQRLLELRPAIKRLFISGFTADVIAQRGILDDGVNFLSKPFDRDALAHKVREVLE